jgi:hypothetical protein
VARPGDLVLILEFLGPLKRVGRVRNEQPLREGGRCDRGHDDEADQHRELGAGDDAGGVAVGGRDRAECQPGLISSVPNIACGPAQRRASGYTATLLQVSFTASSQSPSEQRARRADRGPNPTGDREVHQGIHSRTLVLKKRSGAPKSRISMTTHTRQLAVGRQSGCRWSTGREPPDPPDQLPGLLAVPLGPAPAGRPYPLLNSEFFVDEAGTISSRCSSAAARVTSPSAWSSI